MISDPFSWFRFGFLTAVAVVLLLAGCLGGGSVTTCPPLTQLSAAWQDAYADELEALPAERYPHVVEGSRYWARLRDQVRACQP